MGGAGQSETCPYCGKENLKDKFEELSEQEYGNGYKITLDEFKHVLKDASKYMIRAFFRKNIDIYSVEISKTGYTFRDKLELSYAYHHPTVARHLNALDPAERRRLLLERKDTQKTDQIDLFNQQKELL